MHYIVFSFSFETLQILQRVPMHTLSFHIPIALPSFIFYSST